MTTQHKASSGHIIFLHETMQLTPAEIARRTGRSPGQVSRILSRYYAARRHHAAQDERKPKRR